MSNNRLANILGTTVSTATVPNNSTLPLTQLHPNSQQPRQQFDEKSLSDLAASIKEQGILQPLLVRPHQGTYEIIAGERRWRAAKLAGLKEVPVLIRHLSDDEAQVASLLENIQRKDLSPFEEIDAKLKISAVALGLTPSETIAAMQAARLSPGQETGQQLNQLFQTFGGESWQSYASNKLAVYSWSPTIIEAMRQGLEFTKAKLIQSAPPDLQAELITLALQGSSRSELQTEIRKVKSKVKTVTPYQQLAQLLGNQRHMAQLSAEKTERVNQLIQELLEELR